jgi:dynein heavy chain
LELEKAITGIIVMSASLEKMFTSMLDNQVPEKWKQQSYPSLLGLEDWVQDLHSRIAHHRDWLVNGQPKSFWISGFFFPQGLLFAP